MKIVYVLTERGIGSLDRVFTYLYHGEKDTKVGTRVIVPFSNREIVGYVEAVEDTDKTVSEIEEVYGMKLSEVASVLDDEPLLNDELLQLAKQVADYFLAPRITVLQAMLPPSLRPASSTLHAPKIAYEYLVRCVDSNEEGLTDKQIELLRLVKDDGPILKKECGSPSVLKKLLDAKRVEIIKEEKRRYKMEHYEPSSPLPLTYEQKQAYEAVLSSDKDVFLLQGVTGSGKTEVYLHLSSYFMEQGKTILMLVPEISLTPKMVEYFARRFQNNVAILHSGLTQSEKYDEYRRIARGEAKIVVGARSAVFAPLTNIGLIIIDEEHVESYKQDNLPYYHAREVAIMRAKHNGCKLLLGSATPSMETKARAAKGVYGYAKMEKRVHENPLPATTIVDLCRRESFAPGETLYSKKLLESLQNRLEKGEQSMILINRRGYSSYVCCSECGHVFVCPSCQGNLTYHRRDEMLKCHRCGYVQQYPTVCPHCQSKKLMRVGFGTERIVKTLLEHFPNARIARLDSDVSKVRNQVEKTLKEFASGEYDILVGTQMIAKGHDFPNVTLVGVVLADIGLSLPSYRASENTFQLLTQAVGRAGRGNKPGEAIIQTYNPTHYAITLGAKQDYEQFFYRELQMRKVSLYPPYTNLIVVEFSSKSEDRANDMALSVKMDLQSKNLANLTCFGPSTPYLGFIGGMYKKTLVIKAKNMKEIKAYLKETMLALDGQGGVRIHFDVNPLDC